MKRALPPPLIVVLVWFRRSAHGREISSVDDGNLKLHKTLRHHHAQAAPSVSDGDQC